MKKCPHCGAEYPDGTIECPIDHNPVSAKSPAAESQKASYEFAPVSPEHMQQDLVTLVTCVNLVAADLVVSRLRAADIEAFIPDEFLMQSVGLTNTFGYVRVQVSPKDYEAAKALLSEDGLDAS
jgi:hypothetical protein